MVDWVTLKLKIVELIRINTFVVIQRGIPHSGTIIYMTFFCEKVGNYFICCESNPWLLPVVSLDPEVRLYRGGARVSLVKKRHKGTIHSRPLRGTGTRAHDDTNGHQEDCRDYGTQHHGDSPDISDYLLSSGVG